MENSFEVNGKSYELLSLDEFDDLELGELEILEEVGGLELSAIGRGVNITARLMRALVYVSMLRSDPGATLEDAGHVKLSVLNSLAAQVASEEDEDEEIPPTVPGLSGLPGLESASG